MPRCVPASRRYRATCTSRWRSICRAVPDLAGFLYDHCVGEPDQLLVAPRAGVPALRRPGRGGGDRRGQWPGSWRGIRVPAAAALARLGLGLARRRGGGLSRLPGEAALMSVSEWELPIRRGGVDSVVGEYTLSAVGPGPRGRATGRCAPTRPEDAGQDPGGVHLGAVRGALHPSGGKRPATRPTCVQRASMV